MPRQKNPLPLITAVARAFKGVGKLQRRGKNHSRRYPFTYASDVLAAVRDKLLSQDIIIHLSEGEPRYERNIAQTNGGESLTECNLAVTYTFMNPMEKLPPMTVNGVGRDVDDKSLYKAQTGAQKALLKRFGLMAEDTEDPEFDQGGQETGETLDDVAPLKGSTREKTLVTPAQIRAFEEACASTGKTADQVSAYLLTNHKVSELKELGRGKPFTQAIVWASDGKGTLDQAPKPQAVPDQGKLPLRTATQPIELKIGNKTVSFEPDSNRATFSV